MPMPIGTKSLIFTGCCDCNCARCVISPATQFSGTHAFQLYSQSTLHGRSSSLGHAVPPLRASCVMIGIRFCMPIDLLHAPHAGHVNSHAILHVRFRGPGHSAPLPAFVVTMVGIWVWVPPLAASHSDQGPQVTSQSREHGSVVGDGQVSAMHATRSCKIYATGTISRSIALSCNYWRACAQPLIGALGPWAISGFTIHWTVIDLRTQSAVFAPFVAGETIFFWRVLLPVIGSQPLYSVHSQTQSLHCRTSLWHGAPP